MAPDSTFGTSYHPRTRPTTRRLAVATRLRETPTSRVRWDEATKRRLAEETAVVIRRWGIDGPTDRQVMKAFRQAMHGMLPPARQRAVVGIGQVPWLRRYMTEVITPIEPTPPATIPIPQSAPADDPLLDILSAIERRLAQLSDTVHQQGAVLARQADATQQMAAALQNLRETVRRKREKAAQRQRLERATPPPIAPPCPEMPRLKIIVAGASEGRWQSIIRGGIQGFPGIDVEFANPYHNSSKLSAREFDYLILTHHTQTGWANDAVRRYGPKVLKVGGDRDVINTIIRLRQRHARE